MSRPLALLLLALAAPPRAPVSLADTAALAAVDSGHVSLLVDPRADRYRGDVVLWLRTTAPTRHLRLDANGLLLSRVEMNGVAGRVEMNWAQPAAGGLIVETPVPLPAGRFALYASFVRPWPGDGRGLVCRAGPLGRHVEARLDSAGASAAFPCLDRADRSARWRLEVMAPAGFEVASPLARGVPAFGRPAVVLLTHRPQPAAALKFEVRPAAKRSPLRRKP